jgi:hypothetical protein
MGPTTVTKAAYASERDFYALELPGVDPAVIEKTLLGRVESEAAPILEQIRSSYRLPIEDGAAMGCLVAFVALLHVRTSAARDRLCAAADVAARRLLARAAPNEAVWEVERERARAAGLKTDKLTYETVQSVIHGKVMSFDFHSNVHLLTMVTGLSKLVEVLVRRPWTLFVAPPRSGLLVASDCPVAFLRKSHRADQEHDSESREIRLADPRQSDTVIAAALGARVALVSDLELASGVRQSSPQEIAMLNAATALPDARAVYAETRSFRWLDQHANEIHDSDALPEAFRRLATLRDRYRDEVGARFRALLDSQDERERGN